MLVAVKLYPVLFRINQSNPTDYGIAKSQFSQKNQFKLKLENICVNFDISQKWQHKIIQKSGF